MLSITKAAEGLNSVKRNSLCFILSCNTLSEKRVRNSALLLCSNAPDKIITQNKMNGKKSVIETTANTRIPPSYDRFCKLKTADKYVLLVFSPKGKYKSINDIPDRISVGEFQRAYSMQRIYGGSFLIVFFLVLFYAVVKQQKWEIENSESIGEGFEAFSKSHGHDVGQKRPPQRLREK